MSDDATSELARRIGALVTTYNETDYDERRQRLAERLQPLVREVDDDVGGEALLPLFDLRPDTVTAPLLRHAQELLSARGPAIVEGLLRVTLGGSSTAAAQAEQTLAAMDQGDVVLGLIEVLELDENGAGDDAARAVVRALKTAAVDRLVVVDPPAVDELQLELKQPFAAAWAAMALRRLGIEVADDTPASDDTPVADTTLAPDPAAVPADDPGPGDEYTAVEPREEGDEEGEADPAMAADDRETTLRNRAYDYVDRYAAATSDEERFDIVGEISAFIDSVTADPYEYAGLSPLLELQTGPGIDALVSAAGQRLAALKEPAVVDLFWLTLFGSETARTRALQVIGGSSPDQIVSGLLWILCADESGQGADETLEMKRCAVDTLVNLGQASLPQLQSQAAHQIAGPWIKQVLDRVGGAASGS